MKRARAAEECAQLFSHADLYCNVNGYKDANEAVCEGC